NNATRKLEVRQVTEPVGNSTTGAFSTHGELLDKIDLEDVRREGFPDMSPAWLIDRFCVTHRGWTPRTRVDRIAFRIRMISSRSGGLQTAVVLGSAVCKPPRLVCTADAGRLS